MTADRHAPAAALGRRTYVVLRYGRAVWAEPPVDEITPLGTVRADTRREAQVRAWSAWAGEPAAALRVRRASACRPALVLEALVADGAAGHARGRARDAADRGGAEFDPS